MRATHLTWSTQLTQNKTKQQTKHQSRQAAGAYWAAKGRAWRRDGAGSGVVCLLGWCPIYACAHAPPVCSSVHGLDWTGRRRTYAHAWTLAHGVNHGATHVSELDSHPSARLKCKHSLCFLQLQCVWSRVLSLQRCLRRPPPTPFPPLHLPLTAPCQLHYCIKNTHNTQNRAPPTSGGRTRRTNTHVALQEPREVVLVALAILQPLIHHRCRGVREVHHGRARVAAPAAAGGVGGVSNDPSGGAVRIIVGLLEHFNSIARASFAPSRLEIAGQSACALTVATERTLAGPRDGGDDGQWPGRRGTAA